MPTYPTSALAAVLALCLAACNPETLVAVEQRSAAESPTGYHTRGTSMVDAGENVLYLKAVSWYGLESRTFAPHGLSVKSMASVLDHVKRLRFNAVRVTWSSELFDPGSTPTGVDVTLNPDLRGKSGPEIMDQLVVDAGARGLKVILSHHQSNADSQDPLWYDAEYSDARWIDDWKRLAGRYLGNPTVVGCDLQSDLRNPATWGDGNAMYDWRAAAERAGNAILDANPDVLVIVEGIETFGSSSYWRGGNLQGVMSNPVRLNRPGHLVYAAQDFSKAVNNPPPGGVPWFTAPNYPKNLETVWDANWGNVLKTGVPVFLASFGTLYADNSDQQWLAELTAYIGKHDLSFAYWALNPESMDTRGILGDDWETENTALTLALDPLLSR